MTTARALSSPHSNKERSAPSWILGLDTHPPAVCLQQWPPFWWELMKTSHESEDVVIRNLGLHGFHGRHYSEREGLFKLFFINQLANHHSLGGFTGCPGTTPRTLGNEDVWDQVSIIKAVQCGWKQRLINAKAAPRTVGAVEWTPHAAGAQGQSWAEARPRPGKKPGSEEEDATELSCKSGLGTLGMASNVAPEAFRSFTDFLVSGLNSFLSDPLRNPKRLPCPATGLHPVLLPESQA